MAMVKKIGVFTGNRAEYGLLVPIIREISRCKELDLRLYVSGAHLATEFGNTLREIEDDGFTVFQKVAVGDFSGRAATARSIADGILNLSLSFESDPPDALVVYADRFEGFAAVIAASQMCIPVVHLEGGDNTEGGTFDDSVRHAMTKLSHIHLVTNELAKNRVLAMGEESWRVFNVGLPALDSMQYREYVPEEEIFDSLRLDPLIPTILFTLHPITGFEKRTRDMINLAVPVLIALLDKGYQVIATYPNNDAGSRFIIEQLVMLSRLDWVGFRLVKSLGRKKFHGLLAKADNSPGSVICLGNSSAFLKETPMFRCPAVILGGRQKGRLQADNILDGGDQVSTVVGAVELGVTHEFYAQKLRYLENPYGTPGVGRRAAKILTGLVLGDKLVNKKMTLVGEESEGWYR